MVLSQDIPQCGRTGSGPGVVPVAAAQMSAVGAAGPAVSVRRAPQPLSHGQVTRGKRC